MGQVSNVKKLLADREWIDEAHGGFMIIKPEQLLREWLNNYTYRKNKVFKFYSLTTPADIEMSIAKSCEQRGIKYALTGFSAAARYQPVVKYQKAFAFVQSDISELASSLNLKEVPSGENVILLSPYDEGVFYGSMEVNGLSIASPIQVFLDLNGFRGRGEEAAEALFDEVIKKKW